jgi:hypothetical protein
MFLYTMEFYSAKKKSEILSSVCNWMELKKINSRDVGQVQKATGTYFLSDMLYRPNTNTSNIMKSRSCYGEGTCKRGNVK